MALPAGDQEKDKPTRYPHAAPAGAAAKNSFSTEGSISVLIASPPATDTVQNLGLGAESNTQREILFPSGCQAAVRGSSLYSAIKSARTSRGGVPSRRTT